MLQKFLLYICPDRPGTVSRDFVCFLSRSISVRKTFSRSKWHGFPKFPQGQVRRQRHQPLPRKVRKHPQVLHVEDGVLHKEDLERPVGEGSTEERLKEMEQEVIKYKKMVERSVEDNFDMMNELKTFHKKETKGMLSSLSKLEEKLYALQAQIYDLQNQNCEYELKLSRMGLAIECRIPETKMSFETREPLPWKRFAKENMFNPKRKKNKE